MDTAQQIFDGSLSPIVLFLVASIAALVGGYFGSYLGERGRNRATREDFVEIKQRLRASAETTSKVEALISRGLWIDQKRWEFRQKVYLRLIELLATARDVLQEVWSLEWEEPLKLPESAKNERVSECFEESDRVKDEVREEIDLRGRLFLSAYAVKVVERYLTAEKLRVEAIRNSEAPHQDKAAEITSWVPYLQSEVDAAFDAYEAIVQAAKADLLLDSEFELTASGDENEKKHVAR